MRPRGRSRTGQGALYTRGAGRQAKRQVSRVRSEILDMVVHLVGGQDGVNQDERLNQLANAVLGRRAPGDPGVGVPAWCSARKSGSNVTRMRPCAAAKATW